MSAPCSCPRCDVLLAPIQIEEVGAHFVAHQCGTCGGKFFEAGDLQKVDDIIAPVFLEIRRIPASAEQQRSLDCPFCPQKILMIKVRHQRDPKVIMDVCPSCEGIWLDKGELRAIQTEGLLTFLVHTIKWVASLRDE